jgi:hypothetical protein
MQPSAPVDPQDKIKALMARLREAVLESERDRFAPRPPARPAPPPRQN